MDKNQQIQELLTPLLEGTEIFLIQIKIQDKTNIKVFLDADKGFTIDMSSSINRKLRKSLEEAALFLDNDFSLEVSSPGIDSPLQIHRQYVKNIGRNIEIKLKDEGTLLGKILEVGEKSILIEQILKTKSKEIIQTKVLFDNIAEAKIQIAFK